MNYRTNEDKRCLYEPSRPLYNTVLSYAFTNENATEPVTLDEVKRHLQMDITFTEQDTYLTALIKQCRQVFEEILGVSMIARTVTAVLQNELGNMELPYGQVNVVSAAADMNGTAIDPANYVLRGSTWKYLETKYDWVSLTYTTTAYVPFGLKMFLLEEIAYRFNHRGDEGIGGTLYAKGALSYRRGSWLL